MKLKEYNYEDQIQLTKHFCSREWNCKCGKKHSILIADTLPPLLETLMEKIGAMKGDISSGYRCNIQDKIVGGNGSNTHQGYACDIKFTDANGKIIESKKVCLALEDLGHHAGIGYKCGGSPYYTHIDVKPRKWYGDESISMSKSCCTSFYDYFNVIKTPRITYQVYDNQKKKWLNTIIAGEGNGITSYAGNFGNTIGGLKIDKLKYRVHDKTKNKWLNWIQGQEGIGILSYAGNLGNPIDGLQIYNCIYRVHLKNGGWLSWISKVDDSSQGYAGIYGRDIDAIQIKKEF